MSNQPITLNLLKTLKPRHAVYDVRDSEVRGFMVRVTPGGSMFYAVQYTRGKRIHIGNTNLYSPKQARDKARQILADYRSTEIDPTEEKNKRKKQTTTFKQFLQNEFQLHTSTHHKGRPHEAVQCLEKHFAAFFEKRLQDISQEHILKWRTDILKRGSLKKNTINRIMGCLQMLFKLALQFQHITSHPCTGIKPLACPDERVRYLSEDEEQRLHSALDTRDEKLKKGRMSANEHRRQRGYALYPATPHFGDHLKPAVIIALHTGLRKSELFGLKIDDLDFHAKNINIKDSKSNKQRNIPMNDRVVDTLKKWIAQQQHIDSPYLFPSLTNPNTHMLDANKSWDTLLQSNLGEKALIEDFHWHDLRHDFASKLVMAGVDLNTVRELLGHADIKMTLRYAHLAPEHLHRSVAKLLR